MLKPLTVKCDGMPMVSWSLVKGVMTYKILIKVSADECVDLHLTASQYNVLKKY